MIKCTFEEGNLAHPGLRHLVVGVIVVRDDQVLLVKRTGKLLEGGKWAIVGGFMDRDETMIQTAEREVLEETGWTVKNLRLMQIIDNPDRPGEDRQNISFVYVATGEEKIGKADWESDEQRWFKWTELPATETIAFDHAENLAMYLKYLKEPFDLPVIG